MPTEIRVDYRGKHTIRLASPLAETVAAHFASENFCGLCDAHPSSGHKHTCPLVVEAASAGHALVPEPERVDA
jgi:hypothetical protein